MTPSPESTAHSTRVGWTLRAKPLLPRLCCVRMTRNWLTATAACVAQSCAKEGALRQQGAAAPAPLLPIVAGMTPATGADDAIWAGGYCCARLLLGSQDASLPTRAAPWAAMSSTLGCCGGPARVGHRHKLWRVES